MKKIISNDEKIFIAGSTGMVGKAIKNQYSKVENIKVNPFKKGIRFNEL